MSDQVATVQDLYMLVNPPGAAPLAKRPEDAEGFISFYNSVLEINQWVERYTKAFCKDDLPKEVLRICELKRQMQDDLLRTLKTR